MNRREFLSGTIWCSAALAASQAGAFSSGRRQNVILIMTDNHGAWTLGCYGNPDIKTPHIDRLAAEGIRFTQAFSSNAVCSPTRATYLTGLLPSQHGVHCYLNRNEAQMGANAYSTIEEFRTLPEILAGQGYTCGLAGKWHLGKNMQPQEGFSYWITMPHGGTETFYGAEVIEHGKLRIEPRYLTDLWTEHGIRFIEGNKQRPFFLFLSYNGPYGLGSSLNKPARNRHADYYADKELLSFAREPMHPWLYNNKQFLNNVQAMRRYACELSAIDDGVGQIIDTLKRLGLDEDTLVVFTADQGWAGGEHGLWGMGDHTRPLHAFDSTMRVPLIFRHPGRIPAGRQSEIMVSNYDLLVTLLNYLGLAGEMPTEPAPPGRDYSAALKGKNGPWEDVVFFEFENVRAIRTPEWKYIERHPDGPHELYDLSADPGERFNLFGQPKQADIQSRLRARLYEFFNRYARPKYDLWHNGGSKTHLLTAKSER
ncbi:MAG TPA: sulfatase-like hydrolase/transferase [Sedimentisphaerales bacterium]|nr:sulfatase-like hydrolase/transferase [Sedimentisphaerales bacterium]